MKTYTISRKISKSGKRFLITLPMSLNLEWQNLRGKLAKITIEIDDTNEAGEQAKA